MQTMLPESGQKPHKWTIVSITFPEGTVRKVFSGSYGGYGGSDDWRLSSTIVEETDHGNFVDIRTESGSTYTLYKQCHGMSGYMSSVWHGFVERAARDQPEITLTILEDYNNG